MKKKYCHSQKSAVEKNIGKSGQPYAGRRRGEFWLNIFTPPEAAHLDDKSRVLEKAAQIYPDLWEANSKSGRN